jgi:hypothetical protein
LRKAQASGRDRRVRDFNEQDDIRGARVACPIIVGARPQQQKIGFGLVEGVETQRVLDADKNHSLGRGAGEEPVEPFHKRRMRAADWV